MRARAETTTLGRAIRRRFSLLRQESGQSLVVIVLSIFVVCGIAALAIDLSTWYQKHHNAQVAADAAALAAANCLAYSSSTNTGSNTCTSTTDTNAQNVATTIASANGYSTPSVTVGSSAVTVTVSTPAPTVLAGLFNLSPTVSAHSVASFTIGTSTACTTIGANCYSVFAMGTSCTNSGTAGSGGAPIYLSGKGDTITGIVHSNGTVYEQGKGQTMNGASATYGTGCTPSLSSGSTSMTAGSNAAPWPNNYYSTTFPACSGSSCTGPCPTTTCSSSTNHTPSYCTNAATSYAVTTALSSGVYCVVGTGNPNDPSTYTGLFRDQTSTAQTHVTVLAGAWQCSVSGCTESAYGADPVICAASTNANSGTSDGVAVDMQTNSESIVGPIFAEHGTIEWNGDGSGGTFLEAQQIMFQGGSQTILGDGPTGAQSQSTQGTDSLTQ